MEIHSQKKAPHTFWTPSGVFKWQIWIWAAQLADWRKVCMTLIAPPEWAPPGVCLDPFVQFFFLSVLLLLSMILSPGGSEKRLGDLSGKEELSSVSCTQHHGNASVKEQMWVMSSRIRGICRNVLLYKVLACFLFLCAPPVWVCLLLPFLIDSLPSRCFLSTPVTLKWEPAIDSPVSACMYVCVCTAFVPWCICF